MAYVVIDSLVSNEPDADDLFVKVFDDLYQLPGSLEEEKIFEPEMLSYVTHTL